MYHSFKGLNYSSEAPTRIILLHDDKVYDCATPIKYGQLNHHVCSITVQREPCKPETLNVKCRSCYLLKITQRGKNSCHLDLERASQG